MMTKYLMLLLAVSCCALASLKKSCPPLESTPCSCYMQQTYPDIFCSKIGNQVLFEKSIQQLKGYMIGSLELFYVNATSIPVDLFKGLHIEQLRLAYFKVKNNSFQGNNSRFPFQGLEASLHKLQIENSFDRHYEQLQNLKLSHLEVLNHLKIRDVLISEIGNDWFSDGPRSLKYLRINAAIRKLGDKVFQSLDSLVSINLDSNFIVNISRSMLPTRAHSLRTLELQHNNIRSLPSDIFSGMPSLINVDLSFNVLHTLEQNTWSKVLLQLRSLSLLGNIFMCNNQLKWLCKSRIQVIEGKCAEPYDYRGLTFNQFCKFSQ